MIQKEWDMQSLSDALLQSVRRYGIKEVSMGQYEAVCKKIVHFHQSRALVPTIRNLKRITMHLSMQRSMIPECHGLKF